MHWIGQAAPPTEDAGSEPIGTIGKITCRGTCDVEVRVEFCVLLFVLAFLSTHMLPRRSSLEVLCLTCACRDYSSRD